MSHSTILELAMFTQDALQTIKSKLPGMILEQLQELEQQIKHYDHFIEAKSQNDTARFVARDRERLLVKKVSRTIKVIFLIASDMGPEVKELYFQNNIPSRILKKRENLHRWVKEVLYVMAQPENTHFDQYKDQLVKLHQELGAVISLNNQTQFDRANIVRSGREIKKALKESYQTLKLYLKGWLKSQPLTDRTFFKDLRLTPAIRKVKGKTQPLLPSPISTQ